jgi:MinD superfamily P-loop ATPase
MKQLVVLSGKGGTGKTSITAALADLASRECRIVLIDADADAANLGLLFELEPVAALHFAASDVAVIDSGCCLLCGACQEVCRFGAVIEARGFSIDPSACEGCGACLLECPSDAIRMEPRRAGSELHEMTRLGPLLHGDLLPGHENTGKLVATLRRSSREVAQRVDADLAIIDGPPGIGCPVLAASTGVNLALLVTEPSVSALHDLKRVLDTLVHFEIPAVACLNKADLHEGLAARIRAFLDGCGVPLVGEIPYHPAVRDAVERGLPATALGDEELTSALARIWAGVRDALSRPARTAGASAKASSGASPARGPSPGGFRRAGPAPRG